MEATTTTVPRIHPITNNHKPHTAVASPSSSPPPHLSALDRDSAVALGVLLLLILIAIIWVMHTRIKRRRERNRDLEHLPLTDPRMGIYQTRIFRVDRKDSRQTSQAWPGPFTDFTGEDRRASIATLPRYEPRRMSGIRAMSQARRDRRWWGSVAAHGSTASADRDEQHLPPLPPSPTLSSLSYDGSAFRSTYRSMSRASVFTNPRECSIVGRDWMPFPQGHVHGLERPDRIGGFRGVSWESERLERGLEHGGLPSMRRSSVTVCPGEPASISQDWAAGKV
ncbi:hypothetical protein K458DRAFT_385429 [Lentithecium fluviatile CBS 122367]|uniref:Uncharacterized protein n=1 Tax=Lentithecium fluviatile CBS 122367 TaxID=1168545 RepID=A0A6G1JCJ4_9PLEO|nr:hypothetical protein K458DRAFT_385429 [Lentithecium fluviatile CBS 122367]